MNFKYYYLLFFHLLFLQLMFGQNINEQNRVVLVPRIVDGEEIVEAFMQGKYTEVGVGVSGSFGTAYESPDGFHGNTFPSGYLGSRLRFPLGFVVDPDKDGWELGDYPQYHGDFFLPGTPEEGWGISIGEDNYNNNSYSATGDIEVPGRIVSSSEGDLLEVTWEGTIDGLAITQRTYFQSDATFFIVDVEIENTTTSITENIYYMRNVDADHEIEWDGGNHDAKENYVEIQPTEENCNKSLVSSVGSIYGMYLGIASLDSRARVLTGGYSNRDAQEMYDDFNNNTSKFIYDPLEVFVNSSFEENDYDGWAPINESDYQIINNALVKLEGAGGSTILRNVDIPANANYYISFDYENLNNSNNQISIQLLDESNEIIDEKVTTILENRQRIYNRFENVSSDVYKIAITISSNEPTFYTLDNIRFSERPLIGNSAISISYNLGVIPPLSSTKLSYAYILDESQIEGAFEALERQTDVYAYDLLGERTSSFCTFAGSNEKYTFKCSEYENEVPEGIGFQWRVNGNLVAESSQFEYSFASSGYYTISLDTYYQEGFEDNCLEPLSTERRIWVDACEVNCDECIPSFMPTPGGLYVLSAWVKIEDWYPADGDELLETAFIELSFANGGTLEPFTPTGDVIDGWRRIESTFKVPNTATDIKIRLKNDGDGDAFFDDIRIHPFKSNMTSYVYDPLTGRLVAQLDENNYAAYYEYDEEGNLVRMKKETERGVKTIQESRSSNVKERN